MKLLLNCNIAAHYRAPIFELIDKEIGCDFCFGDKLGDIKKMDYTRLHGRVITVHNIISKKFEYQKGLIKLLFTKYNTYILYASPRCVSMWLFLVLRKLFFSKKKVYGWSHGMLGKEGRKTWWIYRRMFNLLDGAFIYNERSTQIMAERGIPASKLHTIYNSLDYDKQLPLRESLVNTSIFKNHFENDNKNIIFIGRLTKVKRFDLLIDAISLLKGRGELVNVTFIGDGEERNNMERLVEEKSIKEQVWFYGACYDERTNAELIYNADLCVSPGNIGLTAMHVLMFGCPAITNDGFDSQMPEFEAIQENNTGAFFKEGDSVSLADCISRWFKDHKNEREKVRESCYQIIDTKWNPHNQIRILKAVLDQDN